MFTETIANTLCRWFGVTGYFVIAFMLMVVVPLGMLVLLVRGPKPGREARFGFLIGMTAGVWASLCWLVAPYCGGYPNLAGLFIGVFFGVGVGTWEQEITVHVSNAILWPLVGWAGYRLTSRRGLEKDPWSEGTDVT
jgi:hypothetical protein